jgi:hypothetical protein
MMANGQDLADLGKLVARQRGWPAAKAFKAYEMTEDDRTTITASALEVLRVFPSIPGACALMSAAFAVRLEQMLEVPIVVVAGVLSVENDPVFGRRGEVPSEAFATSNLDWDGHIWVMVGPYVADVSIFRTAYSIGGPPRLSRHIDLMFGPNKGLYVDRWRHTRQLGLGYEPQYILSEDEVTGLMQGAFQKIQEHQA